MVAARGGAVRTKMCTRCDAEVPWGDTMQDWHGHAVCRACFAVLRKANPGDDGRDDVVVRDGVRLAKDEAICSNPNCGYRGKLERRSRGSLMVTILLFCLGILPGLLYLIFMCGYDYYCPHCRLKLRSEHV